jgi:hypothetical protein
MLLIQLLRGDIDRNSIEMKRRAIESFRSDARI